MRKYKPKSLFFILLFTFSLLILLFPLNVKGISDVSFTFNNDVITNIQNPSFNNTFNIRSSSQYTEHYNATYSFENEPNDTSGLDIDFVDIVDLGGGTVLIKNNLDGHNKIIEINDSSASFDVSYINIFDLPQISGILEFWIYSTDVSTKRTTFLMRNEIGGTSINIDIDFDKFRYNGLDVGVSALPNTWYHLRFNFSCITDTTEIWINNIMYQSNAVFASVATTLNTFGVFSRGVDSNYQIYFDAIGYSWENTYDFESDSIGSFPNDWIDFSTTGGNIEVISNRSQVVKFEMIQKDVGTANMYNTFSERTIDFIEFDISCNGSDLSEFEVSFESDTIIGVYLIFGDDVFYYNDGSNHWNDSIIQFNNSVWYHNRIYFDTTSDTFTWYINDILYYENVDFLNPITSINNIKTKRLNTGEWHEVLLDNVGYSWNNTYAIGSNLLPYLNPTGFIEVDRYEFALKNVNEFYNDGDSNPSGWSDVESGGGFTKIINGHEPSKDREMLFFVPDSAISGTSKDNFGLTGNFINITFQMTIIVQEGSDGFTSFVIYSSDTTEIATLIFQHDTTLQYWNGSSGIELRNDLVVDKYYEFNLMLNYELDTVFLIYSVNSTIIALYNYPMITTGKSGLDRIIFTTLSTGDLLSNAVDYIGIYENGISQSNELGWLSVDLKADSWNFESNNLLFLTSNGNYHLSIVVNTYSVGETLHSISNFDDYDNSTKLFNTYDDFVSNITNPFMIFTIQNLNFSLNDIKIEGVQLLEGINIHILELDYSNVDIDNSFFRVIGNQLTFTHTSNDSNLEFIQASFNITDISTDGYTSSFKSFIDNNAFGFFRLNFTTTSNLIPIPNIITTTRFIPTQNKTIRSIIILITDRDIDSVSGITTGFVSNIEFIVSTDIGVSILITALIFMIIPLLMILIPSISISQIYGKVLLIPVFLLMSIICVATIIIPIWLFFIIGFSCSMFILKAKDFEGLD